MVADSAVDVSIIEDEGEDDSNFIQGTQHRLHHADPHSFDLHWDRIRCSACFKHVGVTPSAKCKRKLAASECTSIHEKVDLGVRKLPLLDSSIDSSTMRRRIHEKSTAADFC